MKDSRRKGTDFLESLVRLLISIQSERLEIIPSVFFNISCVRNDASQ